MQREHARNKLFSRRAALIGGGQLLLTSALVGRMYYLQVVESERYAMLADDNRISMRLLPPPRGRILDRYGVPLALNQQNYQIVLTSEHCPDVEATLEAVQTIVPLSPREKKRILREIERKRSFVPVTVKENLSWRDVSRIEVNTLDLPGISIDVGESRHYPLGDEAAHLIGYVAAVSEEEEDEDPLLELPGFRIGKNGIEKQYDAILRGKAGNSRLEVNALGRVIRELERDEGQSGKELVLTIDAGLQEFITRRIGDESAAVVVMDALSGDILALVSTPGFDPNAFNQGLGEKAWHELISNPKGPLTNKAISGQFSPGSTFKLIVSLAALESGVITPDQKVYCSGYIELGDSRFHCWRKEGHGYQNMVGALTHSCDVYFYEIARRTGIDRIAAMARRFGLGGALGLDLPSERSGLVPTRDWKLAVIGSPWQKGETLISGIGQGYVLATPLQLAVMTARLVNGGMEVIPHLTRDLEEDGVFRPRPGEAFNSMGISAGSLKVVMKGMEAVANSPSGTAYHSRIFNEGMEMGGKTGTSQVRRISKSERLSGVRKNEELPWKERDHALFVGYAPIHDPRFVVSVVVEHGGGGSKVAAPIARDILLETQLRAREFHGNEVAGNVTGEG